MMKVEERISNFTEKQLEQAYDEFMQFKENGWIGQSLTRNLYDEHKTEIGSRIGYWSLVELMVMREIARRYYEEKVLKI